MTAANCSAVLTCFANMACAGFFAIFSQYSPQNSSKQRCCSCVTSVMIFQLGLLGSEDIDSPSGTEG
jgi:hypothetical protein